MAATKARRPLPPAKGVCRWLNYDPRTGCGRLKINGVDYDLDVVDGGYALSRWADAEHTGVVTYRIDLTWGHLGLWRCDCPDAENRDERRYNCKHVCALKAALKNLPF